MAFERFSRTAILGAVVVIACACATAVGGNKLPQPTPGFVPRREYATDIDKARAAVNRALDINRIPVLSTDNASGVIQTNYIQGGSAVYALGMGGSSQSRYNYNVRLTAQQQPAKVRITIVTKIEVSHSGSAYQEGTIRNQKIATALEDWLYEQIEKALLVP